MIKVRGVPVTSDETLSSSQMRAFLKGLVIDNINEIKILCQNDEDIVSINPYTLEIHIDKAFDSGAKNNIKVASFTHLEGYYPMGTLAQILSMIDREISGN